MNEHELRILLSKIKMANQAFLNDTFLWVNISRKAILEIPGDKLVFEVPKAKAAYSNRTVSRKNGKEVIDRIINQDIYYSAYVSAISKIEDYLNKIIRALLKHDNRRLKVVISNVNMNTNISIIDFVDNTYENMIEKIIDERVNNLFYASPNKQLEFLSNALGIELSENFWNKWVEYKARRDVIVHNSGIINRIYVEKCADLVVGAIGDKVIIDDTSFRNTISDLKSLIGEVDKLIRVEYKIPTCKEIKEEELESSLDVVLQFEE